MDRAGWRNGLDRDEASTAKPLVDLACRPGMAARAEFVEGGIQEQIPGPLYLGGLSSAIRQ
jgi:hypothetical protein